jgi:hypothetical protein
MTADSITKAQIVKSGVALDEALFALEKVAPGAPLIHIGQSPFWDEPTKAVIAARSDRPIIAGIHDLDYFSRQRTPLSGPRWQMLPRNDGTTRDIWIAAGEISALFGAEIWPARQTLLDAGIRLDRLAHGHGRDESFLDRSTEAYGWRGLVYNRGGPAVICDIPARDAAPMFSELLRWAGKHSCAILPYAEDRRELRRYTRRKEQSIQDFLAEHRDASLSDLLMHLLKETYHDLIGPAAEKTRFETTRTMFRFNRETAKLPRFRFVNHFLHARHAAPALEAYRRAIEHSGVMDPALAGESAIPFELYVPGQGRGTLHLTDTEVRIALPRPLGVPVEKPVRNVERLAEILQEHLGPNISLFGKALTLPAMISGEFVMVLTEKGSSYVPRTQKMLAEMRAAGIPVTTNPLLRMRLRTWSSLSAVRRTFKLPPHLTQAFRTAKLTSGRFARNWRRVVREQKDLIAKVRDVGSPCDLVRYLSHDQHEMWFERLERCNKAQKALLEIQKRTDVYRRRAIDVRAKEDEAAEEVRALEKRRGEINRSRLRPLKRRLADLADDRKDSGKALRVEYKDAEHEGKALLMALETKLRERRRLQEKRKALADSIRRIERSTRATAARKLLRQVEIAAEKARLELARNAVLVSQGLPYANVRPSAWWFPALDPSGKWFKRVAGTARFRIEPLQEEG